MVGKCIVYQHHPHFHHAPPMHSPSTSVAGIVALMLSWARTGQLLLCHQSLSLSWGGLGRGGVVPQALGGGGGGRVASRQFQESLGQLQLSERFSSVEVGLGAVVQPGVGTGREWEAGRGGDGGGARR